jgi:hypothetical protein
MARGIPMEMGAKGAPMMKDEKGMGKKMSVEVEIEKGPMEPEEEELMGKAQEMDDMEEEAYGSVAPQGDFSAGGLNALVDGLNSVLPMFGIPDYERFSEGMTTLPPKFVKLLTMVNEAASAAGLDDMTIDLATVTDDKSLKMAAGKLRTLAGRSEFKRFLRSERPEAPTAPAPGGVPEAPMAAPAAAMGMSEEDLMMSRLS